MAHGMTTQNGYHYSRVCFVIFPVGDDPFDILRGVNGSGDHIPIGPSVVIPAYSKSDSISLIVLFLKFPDSPLQPMR